MENTTNKLCDSYITGNYKGIVKTHIYEIHTYELQIILSTPTLQLTLIPKLSFTILMDALASTYILVKVAHYTKT